jgi:predicted RNA binding protein YcfA (HicA-like mRNA interferase family)
MKLPRNVSGEQLAKAVKVSRQTGSHFRLTTVQRGEHHVTIPRHDPIRIGTFAGILDDVAGHFDLTREDLIKKLFGR